MEEDPLAAVLAELEDQARGPFGRAALAPSAALADFSRAGQDAATNLLEKASTARANGDGERADRLVDRAVDLPFDEHEQVRPAAMAAHMMLFNEINDAIDDSDGDDSTWAQAAVDVLDGCDGLMRFELRDALLPTATEHEGCTEEESALILEAVADVPERPELMDLGLDGAALAEHVHAVIELRLRYRTALEHRRAREQRGP